MKFGLERIKKVLEELNTPCNNIPAIQIVGTNGKGSIASFLISCLNNLNIKTGLTTSPHLINWTERISINKKDIETDKLKEILLSIKSASKKYKLTTFELIIVSALIYFNEEMVDLIVLEAGLGGRLDATSAHSLRPLIGISSIGIDHCEYLGDNLTQIAYEKASVISQNCVVVSAIQQPEVVTVINEIAKKNNATVYYVAPLPNSYQLGMRGEFQYKNAAVAKKLLEILSNYGFKIDNQKIKFGLENASWPGRLQEGYWKNLKLTIDCAHNPHAALQLSNERKNWINNKSGVTWIIAIQKSKDAPSIFNTLIKKNDLVFIVPVPNHESWTKKLLIKKDNNYEKQLIDSPSLENALTEISQDESIRNNHKTIVTGSIYLIGKILNSRDFNLAD